MNSLSFLPTKFTFFLTQSRFRFFFFSSIPNYTHSPFHIPPLTSILSSLHINPFPYPLSTGTISYLLTSHFSLSSLFILLFSSIHNYSYNFFAFLLDILIFFFFWIPHSLTFPNTNLTVFLYSLVYPSRPCHSNSRFFLLPFFLVPPLLFLQLSIISLLFKELHVYH